MNWHSVAWRAFFEVAELGLLQWVRDQNQATVVCYAAPTEGVEHLILPLDYVGQAANESNTHIGPARGRWSMANQWMPIT